MGIAALAFEAKKRIGKAMLLLDAESLLNIGFQHTKDGFMALHRHLQGSEQSLGGVKIHDDPLLDVNRILRDSNRLRIQSEVDDQFLGRSRDAAKIGAIASSSFT